MFNDIHTCVINHNKCVIYFHFVKPFCIFYIIRLLNLNKLILFKDTQLMAYYLCDLT